MTRDSFDIFQTFCEQFEGGRAPISEIVLQKEQIRWEQEGEFFLEFLAFKLVQCGVLSEAEEIAFVQTSDAISLEFFGGHKWDWQEVVTAFTSKRKLAPRLEALRFAVRNLVASQDCRFTMEFRQSTSLGWDDQYLRKIESKPYLGPTFRLCFSTPAKRTSWFSPTICPALGRALMSRCYACPVKLTLDRRPLNGPAHDPVSGIIHDQVAPFALRGWKEAEMLTPTVLHGGPHWFVQKHSYQLPLESKWCVPHEEKLVGPMSAFLSVRVNGERQSSFLVWTYHGVIIKREEIPAVGSVGITVLLCGDDQSVDRTTFAFVEGSLYAKQRWEALTLARKALLELSGMAEQFSVVLKPADSVYAKMWNRFTPWEEDTRTYLIEETENARQGLLDLANDFWNS